MRPYKISSSFFYPQGRPFLNFSTLFLFTFQQRVSEDVNSTHIQLHVKITVAKKKYDMRIITKKVGF
jgi:hypothetical protein